MRAKELLNNQREILKFYDRVKKTIDDLSPLRTDPRKTEEYTNSHLFADAQYLATHQDDNKNVPPKIYKIFAVRTEILNILKEDDSFIYAHNIIAENRNGFTSMESLKRILLSTTTGKGSWKGTTTGGSMPSTGLMPCSMKCGPN